MAFLKNKLRHKKGSILVLSAFLIMITVTSILGINKIYVNLCNIISYQNRADAHMLSVIGLYVETLDKVSWINKQLRRIGVLSALIPFVPELAPIVTYVQKITSSLEAYQDILLLKLKTYAPVLDNELRLENKLSVPGNLHYFEYRRQPPIDLVFMVIPGLIEINSEIFRTACVKHKGLITDSSACVDNTTHKEEKGWFAPVEEDWNVVMNNAY